MKKCLPIIIAICSVFAVPGCKPADEKQPTPDTSAASSAQSGTGGALPVSPAAGGLSPVGNSDSVLGAGGGGSGVGGVMKDRAKRISTQAPSSLNQAGSGEESSEGGQ